MGIGDLFNVRNALFPRDRTMHYFMFYGGVFFHSRVIEAMLVTTDYITATGWCENNNNNNNNNNVPQCLGRTW